MDPRVYAGKAADLRTTLALFGTPLTADLIRKAYGFFSQMFADLGYPANVAGLCVLKPKGPTFGRYRRLTRAVEGIIQKDNIAHVELAYAPPPETDVTDFGWLSASFGDDGCFIFKCRRSILDLGDQRILQTISFIVDLMSPAYGYGYLLDNDYGPGFHAVGIGFRRGGKDGPMPGLPDSERERNARWFNRRETAIPAGILRDVFPLNYLTEIHAGERIGNKLLFDWIASDRSHGTLNALREGAWLWAVPEESCLAIGQTFQAAGLLV